MPIQVKSVRCSIPLIELFKADVAAYLRQHGMEPVWSDIEEAREEGAACAVALCRPAERISSADVISCLLRRPFNSGTGLPA